jgi:hypothetical protein
VLAPPPEVADAVSAAVLPTLVGVRPVTQQVLAPALVLTQFAADPDWKPVTGAASMSTAAEAQ